MRDFLMALPDTLSDKLSGTLSDALSGTLSGTIGGTASFVGEAGVTAFVSTAFALAIGGTFILAVWGVRARRAPLRQWASHAPASLTSLGMLGTFVGIFLGLMDFDVFAINASVPTLLAGLKLAFSTSILGLASALLFKWLAPFIARPPQKPATPISDAARDSVRESAKSEGGAPIQLLQALMEEQAKTQRQLAHTMAEALARMAHASQAQHNAPPKEAALEQARLEEVLRTLERRLADESERNFTRIHQALEQSSASLTAWQDNFRDQMIAVREAIDASNAHIASARNEVAQIGDMLTSLPERWQDARAA